MSQPVPPEHSHQPVPPYVYTFDQPPPQPATASGYPQQQGLTQQVVTVGMVAPPNSSWATASLVLGIVGVLGGFCLFGIPCVAAIIAGHVGMGETRNGSRGGRGQAVAGLVLGYLCLLPAALVLLFGLGFGALLDSVPAPAVSATP